MGCWSIAGLPPSIMFAGTHLYTWVDRLTVGVKCLAQEHNTISPARTWTRTARSGVEHTNHKAMAPQSQARLHVKRSLQLSPSMSLQGPGYTCIVHFHASRILFLSISLNPNNNPAVSQSAICKQWKILKTDIKVHLTFFMSCWWFQPCIAAQHKQCPTVQTEQEGTSLTAVLHVLQ